MSRSYVVGLPVVITIDHGQVFYEVDTAEASSAIWEDNTTPSDAYSEQDMREDQADVDRDHYRRVYFAAKGRGEDVPDFVRDGAGLGPHEERAGGAVNGYGIWLTLGEFRRRTAHLSDETPITADGQGLPEEGQPADWYNVEMDDSGIPGRNGDAPPPSIILGLRDDFDTRQW